MCRPPYKCTQLVTARRRDGKKTLLPLRDSVILDSCQHTLASGGKLAAEEGFGLLLEPYDGETYLFKDTPTSAPEQHIPLLNLGVLVLPPPDTESLLVAGRTSHGHVDNEAGRTGSAIHQTFNHRDSKVLKRMADCTSAPDKWLKGLEKMSCDACDSANVSRVKTTGRVPTVSAPGDCMSMDGWSNSIPDIQHDCKQVLGTFDLYSHLDKSYLMKFKSDAGDRIKEHLAWNNRHGVRYKRCHTDNALDLIAGDAGKTFKRWGVHVTTSAPYEPRQNGQMERRWQQKAHDTRVALQQSNFTAHPTGCRYWWYAWCDAEARMVMARSRPHYRRGGCTSSEMSTQPR